VCPSSFIDRRRVRQVPNTLPRSKALRHGHCRVRTSSIGADRGDDGIWIYELAGSFIIFNHVQITYGRLIGCGGYFIIIAGTRAAGWTFLFRTIVHIAYLKAESLRLQNQVLEIRSVL
jgi:hypothetical protein